MEKYSLYKGLQRPLVFKIFKGKFIYWAAMACISSMIVGGIISAFNSLMGILAFIGILISGMFFTISKQKQGLSSKTRDDSIYILQPKQHPNKLKNEKQKSF
jgi:hypothetical protein